MLSLIEQNDGCVPQEKLKCVRQVVEEGSKHLLVKRQSITLVDPWRDASVVHPWRGMNNMLDHIDFLRPVRFHLSKLRLGTFISCAADREKPPNRFPMEMSSLLPQSSHFTTIFFHSLISSLIEK